jgi:hypothetical protein
MSEKRYNVWLEVEEIYIDEYGEEYWMFDRTTPTIDPAKLLDKLSADEAENVCNAILLGFGSTETIKIPREDNKDA